MSACAESKTSADHAMPIQLDEPGFARYLAALDLTVEQQRWQQWQQRSEDDVACAIRRVLQQPKLQLDDLALLLSPAAMAHLPMIVAAAAEKTQQYVGRARQLFAPLYLSNLCANECTYCGFSQSLPLRRRTLTAEELDIEAQAVAALGHQHVLLVTGEHERKVGMAYFRDMIPRLRPYFRRLMLEVQPLAQQDYAQLRQLGIDTVLVYQETYQADAYRRVHLRGNKANMQWRLDCPDRLGRAGMHKIGLGILLGLADWRLDALLLAHHLRYLQKQYWHCQFSMAFPRLRPCAGDGDQNAVVDAKHLASDAELTLLYAAFRLFAPELDLTLSTRESSAFRDVLLPLLMSSLSAGSKTQPGGYAVAPDALAQFSIDDDRSVADIVSRLTALGLQPVWHDWHPSFGR